MKLVMTLAVGDDAELVDAQIAYHANAGVDVVLASVEDPTADTRAILEQYVRAGCLQLRGADSPQATRAPTGLSRASRVSSGGHAPRA